MYEYASLEVYVYDVKAKVHVVNEVLALSQMVPLFHESIETLIARLAKRAEQGEETEAIECVERMLESAMICACKHAWMYTHYTPVHTPSRAMSYLDHHQ